MTIDSSTIFQGLRSWSKNILKLITQSLVHCTLATIMLLAACGRGSLAKEAGPSLNLSDYVQTYSDDFSTLSISKVPGSGARWYNHTPWGGDFGGASFGDPGPGGPFASGPQGLTITASKNASGKWTAGLISSRDRDGPSGQGFAQKFGYFEIKAKLPAGAGVWPAFWLIGVDKSKAASEIDVFEAYGKFPGYYNSTAHIFRGGKDVLNLRFINAVDSGILSRQFNTFGVMIDDLHTTFYFNREPINSIPTPAEYKQPFYILADLSLGGGWPISELTSPKQMEISYIRAYEPRGLENKP